LGPDSVLCEADTVELDGYVIDGIDYLWSSGDTTSLFGVTDSVTYWLQVTNAGCSRRDTISFSGFLPNPELSLGLDSTYCFFIEDTLTLDGGAGISYLWTPTNETTRQIKVMYPATYYVTTTRSNGCPRIASLEVAEVCVPLIFIPSAFTPDGDNLNDVLYPIVNNLVAYNFRILNRWGQTVFYSIDPNEGWDGKYNGADEVPGTYVYRVNFEGLDFEGSKLKGKRFGTITLIR
jgi:gliding motility-associated-like protein